MKTNKNFDYECYFDGACEPKNPGGNMGIGAIILDHEGNKIKELSHFVKANTDNSNNVAEYQAFGWTVTELLRLIPSGSKILIQGDSKLVVCQMNGEWQIKKGAYVPHALRARIVFRELQKKCITTLIWIPREQNEIGDELSKRCMIKSNVEFKIQPVK